jgi:DNA polymerase I-like protein with 3'-5' exonuclease and polymerase domains
MAGQAPLFTPDSDWRPPTELPDWRGRPGLTMDTETRDDGLSSGRGAGWAYGAGRIVGVSAAVPGEDPVYVPICHPDTENFDHARVGEWVRDLVHSTTVTFHKASYDLGWIWREWGIEPPDCVEDSMLMAYCLDEQMLAYDLDRVCHLYGVAGKDVRALNEAAAVYGIDAGKARNVKANLWRLPARYVGPYAAQDAAATLGATAAMRPLLTSEGLDDAYRLECDLIPLVVSMRRRGIRVDLDKAAMLRRDLAAEKQQALDELSRRLPVGRRIEVSDCNSTSFLERVFDTEKVPYPRTAPTDRFPRGVASFESDWMKARDHWLPNLVAMVRQYQDAGEKFVGNYIQDFAHLGRIHAEIHTHRDGDGGTRTTRLAYSDPPLQQMPSRNEDIAPRIRGLFLPEEGDLWGTLDYSQQEYRLIVHLANICRVAGVEDAVRKYNDDPNTDFHDMVVDMTGLIRRDAKDANFAKAFGAGVPKFASMIGKSIDEARRIYETYDEKLPFVRRAGEFCQNRAEKKGYLRMIDGFRTRFNRWEPRWRKYKTESEWLRSGGDKSLLTACSHQDAVGRCDDKSHPWSGRLRRAFTHKAMNGWVQGSAARQIKLAMREMWRARIVPLVQMHDDLNISTSDQTVGPRVAEMMRDVVKLSVPVKVDAEFGDSWGSARKVERRDGNGKKSVVYRGTWDEAVRLQKEGAWW